MDFVDHDPPDRAEVFFHPLPDQNSLESLGSCDHHVWWAFRLASSCTDRRIPVANLDLDVEILAHLLKSAKKRSEEHTSELQSRPHLVCRLLLEKKKKKHDTLSCCVYPDRERSEKIIPTHRRRATQSS